MNRTQALTITRLCKSGFPAMRVDEFTPEVWGEALEPYHFETMRQAVTVCVRSCKFISMAELVIAYKSIRNSVQKMIERELGMMRPRPEWYDEVNFDGNEWRELIEAKRKRLIKMVDERIEGKVYDISVLTIEDGLTTRYLETNPGQTAIGAA